MKYYLHNTNAFNDEKITLLFIKFGYEGLGLFYTILEKLALQEKPISEIVLKKQLNIGKKLEKQLKFMYEINLLSLRNDEVFNENILNNTEKYQIKKEKTKEKVYEWRKNQAIKKNVTGYKSIRNHDKENKSKVNKSKVIKEYKNCLLSEIKISDFPNLKSDYIEISKAFQELFIQIMKENDVNPNMIKNAKGGWIDSVRLMIEQDKYTIENLREVFKYLQEEKVGKDGFAWRNVIQSTSKLREKMSKIQTSIKNEKNKSNNKGATYEEIADLLTSDPRFASLPDR